jgi:hypothetical protein
MMKYHCGKRNCPGHYTRAEKCVDLELKPPYYLELGELSRVKLPDTTIPRSLISETLRPTPQPEYKPSQAPTIGWNWSQLAFFLLIGFVGGFILALWVVSNIGYNAHAVSQMIEQAQVATQGLTADRERLQRTIEQYEALVRASEQQQFKWAIISALLSVLLGWFLGLLTPKEVVNWLRSSIQKVGHKPNESSSQATPEATNDGPC